MNAAEIKAMSARSAIAVLVESTDRALLDEVADKDNRAQVSGAALMRLDTLDDAEPAEVDHEAEVGADVVAKALVSAMQRGDVALVSAMLREVRREEANDDEIADWIVKAFSVIVSQKKKAPPRRNGAITRLRAAIDASAPAGPDGVITITEDAMDAAQWSASWRKHRSRWTRGGFPSSDACEALGYAGDLDVAGQVVTLTPVAS